MLHTAPAGWLVSHLRIADSLQHRPLRLAYDAARVEVVAVDSEGVKLLSEPRSWNMLGRDPEGKLWIFWRYKKE